MALLLGVNVEDKSERGAGLGINLIFLASIHSISFERKRSGCSEVTLTECKKKKFEFYKKQRAELQLK